VLKKLLELGNLGQKTKAGFYKKVGRDVLRFELDSGDYVPGGAKADEVVGRMLKKPAAERLQPAAQQRRPEGQFLWAIMRNGFHYAAVHLKAPLPTSRATSTRPCAGASACSRARSSCGRRPAGWTWRR
jgi:3-hydroxyacyl-CoA dehydrogenase